MERGHKNPAAPPTPDVVPKTIPFPERTGFLARLRNRPEKKPAAPEHQAATPSKPESVPQPPKRRKIGAHVLSLVTGHAERPTPPEAAPSQPPTTPELTPPAEAPEFVRAGKVRRFARTVLRHVMAEVSAEAAKPRPVETTPLTAAAGELRQATAELSTTMGDYESAPEAPRRIFEDVVAERIATRMHRLEAEASAARRTSVLAAGLGIVAVLVAGHQYLAHHRSERARGELKKEVVHQTEVIAVQGDLIAAQRAELSQLQQEHARDHTRAERRDYYEKLSDFTRHQAEGTLEAAHELQQVTAERPRLTWMRETPPAGVEAPRQPQERPAAKVERVSVGAERPTLAKAATPGGAGGGAGGHGAGRGLSRSHVEEKPPLNPAALRQEAVRKARAARLASNAWVYGTALAAVMVGAGIFFLVGW